MYSINSLVDIVYYMCVLRVWFGHGPPKSTMEPSRCPQSLLLQFFSAWGPSFSGFINYRWCPARVGVLTHLLQNGPTCKGLRQPLVGCSFQDFQKHCFMWQINHFQVKNSFIFRSEVFTAEHGEMESRIFQVQVPSGNWTVCHGKSLFFVVKSNRMGHLCHSKL